MDPERWRRIEEVLDSVLDLPPGERAAFLDQRCADDPDLRSDVDRYLSACEEADTGLQLPSFEAITGESELRSRDHLVPGDRVGAYRILELLGRGGMGAVYLAERADGTFQRRVAVKVVKRGMDSDEILARFRHEREILARLQHPNIARLLDGGVTRGGLPYFVMELVEGEPIDRWCDARALDVKERLRLFLQVCDAVRYAHGALVVHRDLKPGNILVHEGEAMLLDFGIAKLLQDDSGGDATGLFGRRLTPEYAAPEQVRGEPTSTASDVYALGVVLYQLLTGELPHRFEGSLAEVERVLTRTDPRPPSQVAPEDGTGGDGAAARRAAFRRTTPSLLRQGLRGDLDSIVLRALAREPERRYPSVEALAQDVEHHLAGRPVLARPDSRWYRASKFAQRNRTLVALAGVASLALVGGSVATTMFALVANQERDRRQVEAERATAARDFVVGLFAELDPNLGQGRASFTREELIDLGAQGLEELAEQPELRASVLNTLGQVAFNLGDRERAEEFFREAYGLLDGRSAEPEIAASMMGIGEALRAELRFTDAEEWLVGALRVRESLLPPGDPRIAESRAALALSLYNQGEARFQEAEAMYEDLRASGTRLPARFQAQALGGFGNLRLGQGRFAQAESLYSEAVDLRRGGVGGLDPPGARVLWGLGHTRRLQGKLASAEEAYREALEVHTAAYGPRHADVAWGHYNLAGVLEEQDRLNEAAQAYRGAAELMEELHQPDYAYTAFAWHGVGRVEEARARPEAAEGAYRRALAFYGEQLPEGDQARAGRMANIHLALGRSLGERGEWEVAERELRTALSLFRDEARSPDGVERAALALATLFAATDRADSAAVYRDTGSFPDPGEPDPADSGTLGGGRRT